MPYEDLHADARLQVLGEEIAISFHSQSNDMTGRWLLPKGSPAPTFVVFPLFYLNKQKNPAFPAFPTPSIEYQGVTKTIPAPNPASMKWIIVNR